MPVTVYASPNNPGAEQAAIELRDGLAKVNQANVRLERTLGPPLPLPCAVHVLGGSDTRYHCGGAQPLNSGVAGGGWGRTCQLNEGLYVEAGH